MILRLESHHVDLLKEEARKTHPIEACAMLFGESTQKQVVVRKVVVAPNKLQSATRFEIHPETVVESITEAEKQGLGFLGLFHSHPAPATPSLIDHKFMKLWGDVVWVIYSSTNGALAAYQMKNGKVREVTIRILRASTRTVSSL